MRELIERLASAEFGTRELDIDIAAATMPLSGNFRYGLTSGVSDGTYHYLGPAPFTSSVDSAIALAEKVLPLQSPDIIRKALSLLGDKYHWHIYRRTSEQIAELPVAICLAVLKAKESEK